MGSDIKRCNQADGSQLLRTNRERAWRRLNRGSGRVIMLYGLYDWTKLIRMVFRQNMFPSVGTGLNVTLPHANVDRRRQGYEKKLGSRMDAPNFDRN